MEEKISKILILDYKYKKKKNFKTKKLIFINRRAFIVNKDTFIFNNFQVLRNSNFNRVQRKKKYLYLHKLHDGILDILVKNFNEIISDLVKEKNDIYINLTDGLKFADANIYGGTKEFFMNYFIPEVSKTDDSKNKIFENCAADGVLKAISSGMKLSNVPVYADIDGFIGTNGKKYKQNIFKKVKLFFFRKLKNYILHHKKY